MERSSRVGLFAGTMGDVILLYREFPSFDLFKDYEERGSAFNKQVKTT